MMPSWGRDRQAFGRRRWLLGVSVAAVLCSLALVLASGSAAKNSPQPAYFFYSNGTIGSVENAADWVVKVTASSNAAPALVVPSAQGIGVDNNRFEKTAKAQEGLRFEFDDEGASSVGFGVPNLVTAASLGVNGLSAGETVTYVAQYTDGANSGAIVVGPSDLTNGRFSVSAPPGAFLDYIDVVAGPTTTSVRISLL